MLFNQEEYDIRCEWGLRGVEELAPISDVILIVDVLSFSTCVDVATQRGALIYPYRWKDESTVAYAASVDAELAAFKRSSDAAFTLSPVSMQSITSKTKLVLPSPNGSTLSLATKKTTTICGCLRNAQAVALYALKLGRRISVIPAGEKWEDGSIRFAIEDLIGAGAIISYLTGNKSPEAITAATVFSTFNENLLSEIKKCGSGKELITRTFEQDVVLACELNISNNVPVLIDGCFVGKQN